MTAGELAAAGRWAAIGLAMAAATWGCSSPLIRSQSPELEEGMAAVEEEVGPRTRLVGDLAAPWGLNYIAVSSVGLVTGLKGTGSDAPPSAERAHLLGEMQSHDVEFPNRVLASPDTSIALVRGYLPPGVQKGDRFDVEVWVPSRSETTSLRGGWLMQSRMRHIAMVENTALSGRIAALAQGPVLVDAVFQGNADKTLEKRGRVLGGGMALTTRPLGLVVRNQYSSVRTSVAIGKAINERFHSFDHGVKQGVATPKDDDYIELRIHPRYRRNTGRYVQVVRSIAVGETESERADRLAMLRKMLLDPITAAKAALQLEAIGREGVEALRAGLKSGDSEVRFYAAEALAYLDVADAADVLAEAARDRAYRWHALTALSAMDHVSAYDALVRLMDDSSAETRVGAFRALRARNPRDPLVRGEALGDGFGLHVISTAGDPMVHFAATQRAEVVLFGPPQRLVPPKFLYAGPEILITPMGGDRLKVSRFAPDEEDKQEVCSTSHAHLIRAIAKVGGGYADVKQAVDSAKGSGALASRVAVDALPKPGRPHRRGGPVASLSGESGADAESPSAADAASGERSDAAGRGESEAEGRKAAAEQ